MSHHEETSRYYGKITGKVEGSPFNENDWKLLWDNKYLPWHFEKPKQFLVDFYARLNPDGKYKRVYVPMCGKSRDLRWLYMQGLSVVGTDIYKDCGYLFMEENPDLEMRSREVTLNYDQSIKFVETVDERLRIYACGYESMPQTHEEPFDMVYDTSAFVALDPSTRQQFVDCTMEIMAQKFNWLHESIDFPPECRQFPPHPLTETQLYDLFGKYMNFEILHSSPNEKWSEFPYCITRIVLFTYPKA